MLLCEGYFAPAVAGIVDFRLIDEAVPSRAGEKEIHPYLPARVEDRKEIECRRILPADGFVKRRGSEIDRGESKMSAVLFGAMADLEIGIISAGSDRVSV